MSVHTHCVRHLLRRHNCQDATWFITMDSGTFYQYEVEWIDRLNDRVIHTNEIIPQKRMKGDTSAKRRRGGERENIFALPSESLQFFLTTVTVAATALFRIFNTHVHTFKSALCFLLKSCVWMIQSGDDGGNCWKARA